MDNNETQSIDHVEFAKQVIGHLDSEALSDLVSVAQNQLEQTRELERQRDISELNRLAGKYGATLMWKKERRKRSTEKKAKVALPVKFRDPNNHDNTWTGRGPKPAWLRNYETQGHKTTEFMVSA